MKRNGRERGRGIGRWKGGKGRGGGIKDKRTKNEKKIKKRWKLDMVGRGIG